MQKRNNLISYAMDFASYLIKEVKDINKIILHGSVPRGDFNEDSDIDLFIDILDRKIEKKIMKAKDEYYKTEAYKKWRLKGIENEISIIVGRINSKEWKNLKRAIVNTGMLLYGKFKSNIEKNYSYVIFVLENIKPDKKRVAIFRKLFGFSIKNEKYLGLINKLNGIKLGKNAILLPAENSRIIKDYFKSKKVTPKIYDIWSDIEILK